MSLPPSKQNPYAAASSADSSAHRRKTAKSAFLFVMFAAVPGWVADVFHALNAHEVYHHSRRLIPWGSRQEEILSLVLVGSIVLLLAGLLNSIRAVPTLMGFLAMAVALVSLLLHGAMMYYARYVLLSFG